MSDIIESRIRSGKRQFETLKRFATQAKGPFETVDSIVRRFRQENQKVIERLKGKTAGKLLGGF